MEIPQYFFVGLILTIVYMIFKDHIWVWFGKDEREKKD
jgi:hypothetical protein